MRLVICILGALLSVSCANPGCLRHSQCDKGFECRDAVCQRPLPHDAGQSGDAEVSPSRDAAPPSQSPSEPPAVDAGSEAPGDAATSEH